MTRDGNRCTDRERSGEGAFENGAVSGGAQEPNRDSAGDAPADFVIIVEGKNDRSRLRRLLAGDVDVLCTFGTPSTDKLARLVRQTCDRHVFIFTDNDPSGRRIRGMLRDIFPDAEHIYTRKGYPGVEGTPDDYLLQQLEKAGLEDYLVYPEADRLAVRRHKEDEQF